MKSQKGITLISLTIYIIGMSVMIAVIAVISSYFYKNIDSTFENIEPLTEYTKFISFFTDEINNNDINVVECGKDNDYIVFDNGIQYEFVKENKGIYRNYVKICRNVEQCNFSYKEEAGKKIVEVTIKIENGELKKTQYTLK